MTIISKDTPLNEITLRRYEKPYNLTGRELVRKLCLTLGVLQPGDSRDVIVDILYTLLKNRREMSSDEIKQEVEKLRENKGKKKGTANSNIRRQLKRLRNIFIVEKIKNNYRIAENATITQLFNEKINDFLLKAITKRTQEYCQKIDEEFPIQRE